MLVIVAAHTELSVFFDLAPAFLFLIHAQGRTIVLVEKNARLALNLA
ncbi:MAG: hypothetical protein NZ775_03915 [Gammaproteobacteria bacterium]|nr:hypothetical protein [Gammaproteobacteria bacterium]